MPAGFIFQQDGAPAHTARVTQEWLHANCPEIIEKDHSPPNSPDLNPLDYHVLGGRAGKVSQTAAEAKDDRRAESRFAINLSRLPQEPINKAVKDFTKRLKACVQVNGGHFEHLM